MKSSMSLRIRRLVDELFNGNNSEFSRKIGISEAGVRSYLGKTLPKADILEKIALETEISCEWLITGKGEMLKGDMVENVDEVVLLQRQIIKLMAENKRLMKELQKK